jgi:glutamine amidotransferase
LCRHVAYVGWPTEVARLLLDEPHALVTQVDAPRCQLAGVTNRDGWGIAWRRGDDWQQRRSTVPFSADHDGQAGLRTLTAPAFMAAIRRASPGAALTVSGNAPFVEGPWAFSLNGFVGGFFEGAGDVLRAELSDERNDALAGDADTEVLFGLVLDRLDAADPAAVLVEVRDLALAAAGDRPSRLNLLLSDGTTIWATRWSNSLFTRPGVVASEPWDDDPVWHEVPDRSVITVD